MSRFSCSSFVTTSTNELNDLLELRLGDGGGCGYCGRGGTNVELEAPIEQYLKKN